MKRKLLNALRVRLGWHGYIIGSVTQPFHDRFIVSIMRPDEKLQSVYVNVDNDDYDGIVRIIHADPDVTEIKQGDVIA